MNDNEFIKKFDAERIIDKSEGLREADKDFLRALAEEVMEYQKEYLGYIEKNVTDSIQHGEINNIISTIVIKKGESVPDGFFTVSDFDEECKNIVFAEREISDVPSDSFFCRAIINGTEERELKLTRTDVLVRSEKKIADIFKAYNISAPYVYSPFARRAFIINDECIDPEHSEIEFCDKDLFVGEMYRNVQFIPSSKLSRYVLVTVNGQNFFRFKNVDEHSFMIADGDDADISFIKHSSEKCVDILAEDCETLDIGISMAEIKSVSENIKGQFTNAVRNEIINPVRIRTKADIVLAVKKYYPYPEEYAGCSQKTNGCTIKDYPNGYKYNYSGGLSIGLANKNYCYLKFEKKQDDIFFEDRVNCFISFMRYNYPEFYWVGVR